MPRFTRRRYKRRYRRRYGSRSRFGRRSRFRGRRRMGGGRYKRSRVGYSNTRTMRAPGYKRWVGGVRKVRGSTRRIAIAAFKRAVPDLHNGSTHLFDGATAGSSFFSYAFGNPWTAGTSGSTLFPITSGIAQGTSDVDRIGNQISVKYLNFTLTMGINNAGIPFEDTIFNTAMHGMPFTVVVICWKNSANGTVSPTRNDFWETLLSGNMANHWWRAEDRETKGTIIYQKTFYKKIHVVPPYFNSTLGTAVQDSRVPQQTWRWKIKTPALQTTYDSLGNPDRNHYFVWVIRNRDAAIPYQNMAAKLTSSVYFAP